MPFKDNIALSKHGFLSVPRRCVCALDLNVVPSERLVADVRGQMVAGGNPAGLARFPFEKQLGSVRQLELDLDVGHEDRDASRMVVHHGCLPRIVVNQQDPDELVLERLCLGCLGKPRSLELRGEGRAYNCDARHRPASDRAVTLKLGDTSHRHSISAVGRSGQVAR